EKERALLGVGAGHSGRCYFHERAEELARVEGGVRAARVDGSGARPLVRLEDVSKTFRQVGRHVRAVADVTVSIASGEVLGLVGESGSGKTTIARTLLGLTAPDDGSGVEF